MLFLLFWWNFAAPTLVAPHALPHKKSALHWVHYFFAIVRSASFAALRLLSQPLSLPQKKAHPVRKFCTFFCYRSFGFVRCASLALSTSLTSTKKRAKFTKTEHSKKTSFAALRLLSRFFTVFCFCALFLCRASHFCTTKNAGCLLFFASLAVFCACIF